jgi:hypothetical protein
MMMAPVRLANATSSVSCDRVAALPVGLLGEQKKMMSAAAAAFLRCDDACVCVLCARQRSAAHAWQCSRSGECVCVCVCGTHRSGKKPLAGLQGMYTMLPEGG